MYNNDAEVDPFQYNSNGIMPKGRFVATRGVDLSNQLDSRGVLSIMAEITHGTNNAYNNHGCRCDDCKISHKKYLKEMVERPDFKHGTNSGSCMGCKCDLCREAHREYTRKYYRNKVHKEKDPSNPDARKRELRHGTNAGYARGCRCNECKYAARNYAQGRKKSIDISSIVNHGRSVYNWGVDAMCVKGKIPSMYMTTLKRLKRRLKMGKLVSRKSATVVIPDIITTDADVKNVWYGFQ